MPASLSSTSIDPVLMKLINLIVGSMVTSPGGSTPVSLINVVGSVSAQAVDCSALNIQIQAPTGQVAISFPGAPFNVVGYIKLGTLGALMNPAVNYVQGKNSSQIGPSNSPSLDSPAITQAGSGKVFVSAGISGIANPQATVAINLYRDGSVLLASSGMSPGGTTPTEFLGRLSCIDTLPDSSPHHYTIQAIGAGGSNLTIPIGEADIQAFEL